MTDYSDSLKAFLKQSSMKQDDFAQALNTTQVTISRYANGERFPDAATATTIDTLTDGAVSFGMWRLEAVKRADRTKRAGQAA